MARTGVPAGAAMPMPCHGMRVLLGPVAVPNWYTMRPCTGQSSWPRSAVVIAAAAVAALQFGHVIVQQAILLAQEIQILVARQQVAEGLRREQHLVPVQGPTLRDVHQPPLEHGAFLGEGVLGEQQVDRGPVDLIRQRINLAVQLVYDAVGRLFLPLDVRQFVGERVHLRAQSLELLLDIRALAADALQTLLVVSQLLIEGGGSLGESKRRQAQDVTQRRHAKTSPQTRRRCLPTEAALPNRPMSVPKPTMASACRFEKNAAWMSQRLMRVYAP